MKKKIIYPLVLVIFVLTSAFIVLKYERDQKKSEAIEYNLLPRQGVLARYTDWPVIQKNCSALQKKIKGNAGDTKSFLKLAAIYLQEARITGNYNYYDIAAMKLVKR